jgi:hypothetical protein
MSDAVMLERIAARRAKLDLLEEQLVKQLAEVRVVGQLPPTGQVCLELSDTAHR